MTTFNVVWSDPVSSSQVASDWETSMEAIGADGSTVHPGTATGPGTWAIAGVPVGPYTLNVTWINGLNLYFQSSADPLAIEAGVGTEPVVAWAAPAVGAPTSVQVGIRELDPVGTRYMTTPIASFVTTGSSVKIPAGLLQAGRWYVAVLTTVWSP